MSLINCPHCTFPNDPKDYPELGRFDEDTDIVECMNCGCDMIVTVKVKITYETEVA